MDILVTGNSGFIGKVLCKKLTTDGHTIFGMDYLSGYDITNMDTFKNVKKADIIIHLAAKSFVPDSFNNPSSFYKTNILGTLNVLETARITKAKVIFFSSYIYGNPQSLLITENHPINPHNPYAQSKYIGEELCRGYFRDFGVPVTVFRPFNIYDNGQNENFLIPTILKQIKSETVNLADPNPKRDYIHVNDIADAVVCAVNKNLNGFEIFNLGTGVSYSVDELVNIIKKFSKFEFTAHYKKQVRQLEINDCYADTNKAKTLLGWEAKINLEEGIENLLNELDL
ncbi:MAG TPA: NAD(P)-dependent oxidoreductase [Paludibacteraceae bacterium]|nr:NAD(P)-dependent oxidoreductase [Paludibacteraceae bacterium]